MSDLVEFLRMGGYARYVWSSFGFTAIVLGGVVFWSALEGRRVRRETMRRVSTRNQREPSR